MTLLRLLWLIATVSAHVGLLVPMYITPYNESDTDWNALIAAADRHPKLPFYVIIKIDNGPPFENTEKDSILPHNIREWASRIGELNNRVNCHTYGYVSTNFGRRPLEEIQRAIMEFSRWRRHDGSDGRLWDIHMDNLFLDEVYPSVENLKDNIMLAKFVRKNFYWDKTIFNTSRLIEDGSEGIYNIENVVLMSQQTCYTTDMDKTMDGDRYRCPSANGSYIPFTPLSLAPYTGFEEQNAVLITDFYETWEPFQDVSKDILTNFIEGLYRFKVHSFFLTTYGFHGNFTMGMANIARVAKILAEFHSWPLWPPDIVP